MTYLPNLLLNIKFSFVDAILIVSLVILLLLSSFFSSCETAFSTANLIRMRNNADEKVKGARKALWIMEHFDKTLSTILVGNNFVNIASTTICAIIFGKFIVNPTLANILNTVIMTIIVLIFGEIMPKSLAKANSDKLAMKWSGVLFVIIKIMTPITYPFYALQKSMLKHRKTKDNPTVTEDELESIIDTMEEEGVLDSEDADLFQGVMDLDTQCVYDIMTPRIDIEAIEVSEGNAGLESAFVNTGFSRIPIYEEDKDHIIGVVHQKDYLRKLISKEPINIREIMTEPLYVAENMKANDLIRKMQFEKKHLAVVIDEHGGTSGIVTFEDAVEEMLGDIYDEHDEKVVDSYIVKINENKYDVNPDIDLDELFEYLEIEHLPDTEYTTLGGYLYELSEDLPKVNQKLEVVTVDEQINNDAEIETKTVKLTFTITAIEDKSIKKVIMEVEQPNDDKKVDKKEHKKVDKKEHKNADKKQHKNDNKKGNIGN